MGLDSGVKRMGKPIGLPREESIITSMHEGTKEKASITINPLRTKSLRGCYQQEH